jgi:hypothetical protein
MKRANSAVRLLSTGNPNQADAADPAPPVRRRRPLVEWAPQPHRGWVIYSPSPIWM